MAIGKVPDYTREVTDAASKRRILNVDDIPAQRYATSRVLRKAGFEVVEAEDGNTALSVIQNKKVDAVVLDVDLPDIDGFEIVSRLRKNQKISVPPIVLISSVFTKEDEVRQGLRGGADAYVSLPLDGKRLVEILEGLIESRKTK